MNTFGIFSLLPILVAIFLAISFRNVILALFVAIWLAGTIFLHGNPILGLIHAVDKLLINSLTDSDHIRIIVFSLLVGAMIGILSKSGATSAFVEIVGRFAKGRRSAQILTWFSGLFIFFDDYANCLIVGNAMRSLFDKLKISRQKLAYLVDSTAAPVASISLISTWVAFQVGLIEDSLAKSNIATDAYSFYIQGIAYNFYPIFTLVYVISIGALGKDYGPMLTVEKSIKNKKLAVIDPVLKKDTAHAKSAPTNLLFWLFLLPVFTLIGVALSVLWFEGKQDLPANAAIFEILGNADPYSAMMKGGLSALILSLIMCLGLKILPLKYTMNALSSGMRDLFDAVVILALAWALSSGVAELGAADYLVGLLQDTLPPMLLPTLVFILAAIVSFSTGTSYGTMGILMPIVIPLAFAISPENSSLPIAACASVLGGSVFGDHCSPISDTTVMSSMGSGCDLLEHVRTQLPYALVTAAITIIFGTLPVGFGFPALACLLLGAGACVLSVHLLGRRA
ncbi:Na+/H+ antiporter NhaC family protein [Sulfobacillus acidophilus]|uniref:Na+/H+ antiporter NhaC family protein n=1 Tax=Sulfobacillus acidophilus TaxID=53633 RepID=A0ABS3AWG2_9FIRM|nr:Na+/H+ antiporter NhaC family protein [Sulfobacillus acidophilus]